MLRLDEMPAAPSGCTAAPVSAIKSTGLRPLSGSARMRSFPMTCPRPVLRVSTSGDAACTCTVSSTAPSDNSTLITGASLTCSTRPVRTCDLKPGRFTSSRYGPTGRLGSVYEPFASVTVVRFKPVAVCVAVTSAPGSTPPLESFTMPVICAVDPACAYNSTLESRIAREPQTTSRRTRFIRPPERTRRRYGSRRSNQVLGREYSCRHDIVNRSDIALWRPRGGWKQERVRLADATVERKGREGRKEILSYFAPFATSAFDRDVL